MKEEAFQRIICIDFDGVIHSYISGWQGAGVVADPPVDGAIDWLTILATDLRFEPMIYSSRSSQPGGIKAIQGWLVHWQFDKELFFDNGGRLGFPTVKPAAWLTVDDRGFHFQGEFPSLEFMLNFKPWYKEAS